MGNRTIVVALMLALAGCGGSASGPTHSDGASSSTPASNASGPAFPKAQAKAAAASALLTISDFPAGWSTSKQNTSNTPADKKAQRDLAACLHAPPGLLVSSDSSPVAASADSPDFNDPNGNNTVNETIGVTTTTRVDQLFAVLRQSNVADCFTAVFNEYIKVLVKQQSQHVDVAKPEVGQISFPNLGDATFAMRAKLTVSAQGVSVDVYVDFVFIRHRNSVVEMGFESEQSPFPIGDAETYSRKALTRVSAASIPSA